MGPALHLIARLYAVEERAKTLTLSAEQRLALRQRVSARLVGKPHQYLLELQPEVLPKSPSGAAVRYALNQWEALTRFLKDGELEIHNGATERANAISRWAAATGHSSAATVAARRRRCCEALSPTCKRCVLSYRGSNNGRFSMKPFVIGQLQECKMSRGESKLLFARSVPCGEFFRLS